MSGRRLAIAASMAAAAALVARAQSPQYDVIIRHGTVLDGTGRDRVRADVAVAGGSIARVGALDGARGAVEIDATGLFVAPGFINIHSHATFDGLARAENMLTQGVTTEIVNADGAGPVDPGAIAAATASRGLAVNVGGYIGFNSVWAQVVGLANRRPTPDETARMQSLITDGLSHGAWGISAGLDYKPGYYAQTEEVIRVVEIGKPWRTNFTNHDRLTPESGYSSRAGMAETIAIGDKAGVTPVITHMKVQGHEQGSADVTLSLMRRITDQGQYTAADAYPYLAGQTGLAALIIPGWAQDGGREAMLKRFADPELRARIVKESEEAMTARFSGGVYIPELKRDVTDLAREMNVSPGEAVVSVLQERSPSIIARFGAEADLVKILKYPATSIACDCGAVAGAASHPRFYGTFPRVLGRYVREQKVITWEDAIRKMTGLPAATLGMIDRGLLAPGMAADIAVFDPNTIVDHATFEDPTLPSDGVRAVLVNGRIALRNGTVTGEQAGRVLTRSAHMPTRPMSSGARRVSLRDTSGPVSVAIDVEQPAPSAVAKGRFRLDDSASNVAIDMKMFGVLQTYGPWASFTGRAPLRAGDDEQSIVVVVDRWDPFEPTGAGTVVVTAGNGYQKTFRVRR